MMMVFLLCYCYQTSPLSLLDNLSKICNHPTPDEHMVSIWDLGYRDWRKYKQYDSIQ